MRARCRPRSSPDCPSAGPDAGPRERVEHLLEPVRSFIDRHAALVAVARRRPDGLETPSYQWMRQALRAWLRQAEVAGELREGADIEYLADALLAPLTPDIWLHQRIVLGMSAERLADGLRHARALAVAEPAGSAARSSARAELARHVDERAHVVVGRAEVDDARPQHGDAVDERGRDVDAAVGLRAGARARGCARRGRARLPEVAERDDREPRRADELELVVLLDERAEEARLRRGCARSRRGTPRRRARAARARA